MSKYGNSLEELGQSAVWEAELMLCIEANPVDVRDSWGVRALACWILRKRHGYRYSWSDIAYAVYGRRKHTTAISGYDRWENDMLGEQHWISEEHSMSKQDTFVQRLTPRGHYQSNAGVGRLQDTARHYQKLTHNAHDKVARQGTDGLIGFDDNGEIVLAVDPAKVRIKEVAS